MSLTRFQEKEFPARQVEEVMDLRGRKYCIAGIGGFGRETLACLMDVYARSDHDLEKNAVFMVSEEYYHDQHVMGIPVIKLSDFKPEKYKVVVAIGDPELRKGFVDGLPPETQFATIIHPSAVISKWVEIGEGSIVTAGTILTCNIKIGRHAHLNLHTTIGHDCQIGDYFTTAPAVNISGQCVFGECVYLGTNSSVRERTHICDKVTVGMGSVVVKNIEEQGVYIGNPARKLSK